MSELSKSTPNAQLSSSPRMSRQSSLRIGRGGTHICSKSPSPSRRESISQSEAMLKTDLTSSIINKTVNLDPTSQKTTQSPANRILTLLRTKNEQALPRIDSLFKKYSSQDIREEVLNELKTNAKEREWLVVLQMTNWETKILQRWERIETTAYQLLREAMTKDEKDILKSITHGDFSQKNLHALARIFPDSYKQIFIYCVVHIYLDCGGGNLYCLNKFEPEVLYNVLSPHFEEISFLASQNISPDPFFLRDIAACFKKEDGPFSQEEMKSFFAHISPQKMVKCFDWGHNPSQLDLFFIENLAAGLTENLGPTFKELIHAAKEKKYTQANELIIQLLKEKPGDFSHSLVLLSYIIQRKFSNSPALQFIKNEEFWTGFLQKFPYQGTNLIKKMIDVRIDIDHPKNHVQVIFYKSLSLPMFEILFKQLAFLRRRHLLEYSFKETKRYSKYENSLEYRKSFLKEFAISAMQHNCFGLLVSSFHRLMPQAKQWEEVYEKIPKGKKGRKERKNLVREIERQEENYGSLTSKEDQLFFSCMIGALSSVIGDIYG